jgi:hydrogenase maturation protease
MKTLVIGLGNPILTDDGVGIYTVRMVRTLLPPEADITVTELCVGGLALMEAMIGYERVILVDAYWISEGQPGRVTVFDAGDLPDTMNSASSHDASLPTALHTGRELGAALPDLTDIQIVAVEIEDVLTFSESPTPTVVAAIPQAASQVLTLLGYPPNQALPTFDEIHASGGYDDFS